MFQAAFLLAFFGFLRVGEFTVQRQSDDGRKILAKDDIQWGQEENSHFMLVQIRFSKTDQHGRGTTLKIKENKTEGTCPVKAMETYLRVRPKEKGPLFRHKDGSPLSRYQFNAVLKKALLESGVGANQYGTHSFRIGAATMAALKGIPPEQIMTMGRWRSDAYLRYIR